MNGNNGNMSGLSRGRGRMTFDQAAAVAAAAIMNKPAYQPQSSPTGTLLPTPPSPQYTPSNHQQSRRVNHNITPVAPTLSNRHPPRQFYKPPKAAPKQPISPSTPPTTPPPIATNTFELPPLTAASFDDDDECGFCNRPNCTIFCKNCGNDWRVVI